LELIVRTVIAALALVSALALAGPCLANEFVLHKSSLQELKAVCDKAGGKFSQDANGYGCGSDCRGGPGTDCTVFCKTDEKCYAQVIGARRPSNALNALLAPMRHAR
jgi:hypothetical protein